MQKGFIALIIIGVVVATIVAVGVIRLFAILPGNVSEKESKSVISEFARMVSSAKPPPQTGLVADPPWDAIKLVEKFASGKIEKDAKIDFQLTHNWGEKYQELDTVSFYVSKNPFRWRADFISSAINYKAIVANNGGEYYSCYSDGEGENCSKVDSLENLSMPGSLRDFLNMVLDVSKLNLFLTQTPQASTRTIVAKAVDCLKVNDMDKNGNYPRDLEICTDIESKLPLFIGSKDNFQQFMLEATKIELTPLPADVFIPSYPN